MNDFTRLVMAFGRGIIKLLISSLAGFGVGLLVLGITTAGNPGIWEQRNPPGELFLGIGAGLLAGGGTLFALFFLPWFVKRTAEVQYVEEPPVLARPAPRSVRYDSDVPPARPAPKPPPVPDDSEPPRVRPAAPPRDEPGGAEFFAK